MGGGYNHTQPNTWETQNYRRRGANGEGRTTTVTFAPPQAYVTTTETVVEKVQTRPIIMGYDRDPPSGLVEPMGRDVSPPRRQLNQPQQHRSDYYRPRVDVISQLDDRSHTTATRPTMYWQQPRHSASPDDPRRHDANSYGNGHRVDGRHNHGYVARDNNYYDHPVELERTRLPATTRPPRQNNGAPALTSATNDINTAVQQLRGPVEPKHGANSNTGTTETHGFVEHKSKPRFKVSVPYIPRNELAYPDHPNRRGGPQTMNEASAGPYGGRRHLPPSRLLSTAGDYPARTVDHETAARLYNGELV